MFKHDDPSTWLSGDAQRKAGALRTPIIAPSILAADFANLAADCSDVTALGAEWLHLDVMDGHFVPNMSFGQPIAKSLRKAMGKSVFFDCHLMVSEPERWVDDFAAAGVTNFTFHIEATQDPVALCAKVRQAGMQVGVALKPKTQPDETLFQLVEQKHVDMVLIMTVEPGFGGQKFMHETMPKVQLLRQKFPALDIEVDGGLGVETTEVAAAAGANVIVAGTSVFAAENRQKAMDSMREIVRSKCQK